MKRLQLIDWLLIIVGIIMILQGIKHYPEVRFWNALMIGGGLMTFPFIKERKKMRQIIYGTILIVYLITNFIV